MRSMPTEIKKNRPDDQMTSCFLKLYTPTRVCEVIIRNWSAGQPVSPKKPDDIRRNGRKKKGERRLSDGTMDIRRRKTRSRNSRAQDTEGRRGELRQRRCRTQDSEGRDVRMPSGRNYQEDSRRARNQRTEERKPRNTAETEHTKKTGRRCP